MKKNKPPEQSQAEFKNKPFKSLKGLAPSPAPYEKKTTASPVRRTIDGNDEDDVSLFLRAVEGARRVASVPDTPVDPAAKQYQGKKEIRALEESQLFLSAMEKIGATFRDTLPERELAEAVRRSPSGRMRQLKRGTIRISQKLDLHGFLKDEALKRLELFMEDACIRGQEAVLVITGKGINSPEGPVLQGAVAAWLKNKGKGPVAEFSPAPRELGGSGAFVVFLKKQCS